MSNSNTSYKVLNALVDQWTSESYGYEENELMKALKEIDRLKNENKELKTRESCIVKEMNLLKSQLEVSNRKIEDLAKKIQEKERHCEKLETYFVNLREYYEKTKKWVKAYKSL